jgi:hypothetical protein
MEVIGANPVFGHYTKNFTAYDLLDRVKGAFSSVK